MFSEGVEVTLGWKWVNPFVNNAPLLHPLKKIRKPYGFLMFSGVEEGWIGNKWVNFLSLPIILDYEDGFNDNIHSSETGKNCKCCHELITICKCQKFLDAFALLNSRLGKLRLIEDFSNPAIVAVVYQEVG